MYAAGYVRRSQKALNTAAAALGADMGCGASAPVSPDNAAPRPAGGPKKSVPEAEAAATPTGSERRPSTDSESSKIVDNEPPVIIPLDRLAPDLDESLAGPAPVRRGRGAGGFIRRRLSSFSGSQTGSRRPSFKLSDDSSGTGNRSRKHSSSRVSSRRSSCSSLSSEGSPPGGGGFLLGPKLRRGSAAPAAPAKQRRGDHADNGAHLDER